VALDRSNASIDVTNFEIAQRPLKEGAAALIMAINLLRRRKVATSTGAVLLTENANPPHRISCATQLAFSRSALMLLAYAFDPIPVLAAVVRKLFGDFIQSARRGPTLASIGVELH
jgi:hypothetical protein